MKKKFFKYFFKTLVSIILLIVLTTGLFFSSVYLSLAPTLKGADGYISVAEKTDGNEKGAFFDTVYENARFNLEQKGMMGGFPKELFDGVLTREYVVSSFKAFLESAVKNELDTFTLTEMKTTLKERFTAYSKTDEAESGITEKEIDEFVAYLDETVIASVGLAFFPSVYPLLDAVYSTPIIVGVSIGTVILIGLCFGLFFLLWRKAINALRITLYGLIGGGFMTIVFSLVLGALKGEEYFTFSTQNVLSYLTAMQSRLFTVLNITGCALAAVGVSLILIIMYFSKERNAEKTATV